MNRGQFTFQKNIDNKDRYQTTIMPTIPKSPNDIYVITVTGDRLDLIANQYYGSPEFWWIIASANSVGLGTTALESGIQLRIPGDVQDVEILYEQIQNRG